jgi:hypothetical protein
MRRQSWEVPRVQRDNPGQGEPQASVENQAEGEPLPVEVGLFSLVREYSDSMHRGRVLTRTTLTEDTLIVQFCLGFFGQLLQHAFDYQFTSIDSSTKRDVVALRLGIPQGVHREPLGNLLLLFEEFCDRWPDLSGIAYGETGHELSDFHSVYIPRLLKRIEEWASSEGVRKLADAARTANEAYGGASKVYGTMVELEEVDLKELNRLVELDYDRAAKFTEGITQREAAIRGLAVTLWTAVLGLAFNKTMWELAGLAALSSAVLMALDAYYSSLFTKVQAHASQLERISGLYYRAQRQNLAGDASVDLELALTAYRFGHRRNIARTRLGDLLSVWDRMIFRLFYPFLIIAAVVAAVLIAVR